MVSMLAPKAPGGGNGDNNGEIHLENPSACLFPRQIPVQCLVGNGIVRLEVTELCWSKITLFPLEKVEFLCLPPVKSGDFFFFFSWFFCSGFMDSLPRGTMLIELFFRYLGSQPPLPGSVPPFPSHLITKHSFCSVSVTPLGSECELRQRMCKTCTHALSFLHLLKKKVGPSVCRLLEVINTFL